MTCLLWSFLQIHPGNTSGRDKYALVLARGQIKGASTSWGWNREALIACGCGICLKCCFDVWCQFQSVGSLGNFYLHFFVLLYKGRKYWPLNRLSSRMMSPSTAPCSQITACRGVGGGGKHSATQQMALTYIFYSFTYVVGCWKRSSQAANVIPLVPALGGAGS